MNRSPRLRRFAGILVVMFLGLNLLAYGHAQTMTHFRSVPFHAADGGIE